MSLGIITHQEINVMEEVFLFVVLALAVILVSMFFAVKNLRKVKEKELLDEVDNLLTAKLNTMKENRDALGIEQIKSAVSAARSGNKEQLIKDLTQFIYMS